MEAILSDCETTEDAIMHAVKWSDASTIDAQLKKSKEARARGALCWDPTHHTTRGTVKDPRHLHTPCA